MKSKLRRSKHSVVDLALRTAGVAHSATIDRILCASESVSLFHALRKRVGDVPLTPATPNLDTLESLKEQGFDPVRLSVRVTDKYRQARHTVIRALEEGKVRPGDLVLCVVEEALAGGGSDLILVTQVEPLTAAGDLADMVRLADGVRPTVLASVLRIACRIGTITGRGKRLGALFVMGDSDTVLKGARPLVPNPFEGSSEAPHFITEPAMADMVVELAKLDGAFVLRGDGLIRAAGAFLANRSEEVVVPQGLGARHVAAAAVTTRTTATAIVVSATDGHVRVFSQGELSLRIDPAVPPYSLRDDPTGGIGCA